MQTNRRTLKLRPQEVELMKEIIEDYLRFKYPKGRPEKLDPEDKKHLSKVCQLGGQCGADTYKYSEH